VRARISKDFIKIKQSLVQEVLSCQFKRDSVPGSGRRRRRRRRRRRNEEEAKAIQNKGVE
jgi:hypothetical protein